jgi:uncharacterized protein Smg (DUF494 family)
MIDSEEIKRLEKRSIDFFLDWLIENNIVNEEDKEKIINDYWYY